jgi:mono/diheme cytochrome c family protein
MRISRLAAASWLSLLLLSAPAVADDAAIAAGEAIVTLNCARCHAVGPTGDSPFAAAPKFRELYQLYDVEALEEALVEGIVTGHPDMPQFEFTPAQASAIIAYLKSLEPKRALRSNGPIRLP